MTQAVELYVRDRDLSTEVDEHKERDVEIALIKD